MKDFRAGQTDEQLSLRSYVGIGPKGNSCRIDVVDDSVGEDSTILIGYEFDEQSKEWNEVWRSDNINGGRLTISESINIEDNPKTFRLTFHYLRPGRKKTWSLTTPAIPYLYEHPRRGSDVADIYLKDHSMTDEDANCDMWKDVLIYDQDLPRKNFNPPNPYGGLSKVSDTQVPETHRGEGWSISLDIVEFEELCDILGWSYQDLVKSINVKTGKFEKPLKGKEYHDSDSDTVLEFVEKNRKNVEKEVEVLRQRVAKLERLVSCIQDTYEDALRSILTKFYGENNESLVIDETDIPDTPMPEPTKYNKVSINWKNINKAAVGNINVYGWPNDDSGNGGLLQTHDYGTEGQDHKGDIKAK